MYIRPPADTRVTPCTGATAQGGASESPGALGQRMLTGRASGAQRAGRRGRLDGQPAGLDKLIEVMNSSLASGAAIAVLASWLTSRARTRQDQQAEIGALPIRADATTVAVAGPQAAPAVNRLLREGPAERARSFLPATLAFFGGTAQARIAGGTDAQSGQVGRGRAVELLSRERVAGKQNAVAVREPLTRAVAAAQLMRCSDPAVVTATEAPHPRGVTSESRQHPDPPEATVDSGPKTDEKEATMTACTTITSPLGDLLLVGEESADRVTLTSLSMPGQRNAPAPRPGWRQTAEPFADVIRQLEAYFAGGLTRFDIPFGSDGTDFRQRVWSALEEIPYGTTTTYGALADQLGLPRERIQALGAAIGANPLLLVRPCHRVIGADGSMRGYAGGVERKVRLLTHEGALQPTLI